LGFTDLSGFGESGSARKVVSLRMLNILAP